MEQPRKGTPSSEATPIIVEDREAFDDVQEYFDTVAGYRRVKQIEQYPRWFQKPFKVIVTLMVLGFACSLLRQFLR